MLEAAGTVKGVLVYGVHGEWGGDVDLSLIGGRWRRRRWEDQRGHLCTAADAGLCHSGMYGRCGFATDSGQGRRSGASRRRWGLLSALLHEPVRRTLSGGV